MPAREGIKLTTWVLIIAAVVGGYTVVKLAPGWIREFQIKELVETAAAFQTDPAKRQPSVVTNFLIYKIADLELPVTPADFHIEDDGETYRIYIDWEREVTFIPDNPVVPAYKRIYKFHDEATSKIK